MPENYSSNESLLLHRLNQGDKKAFSMIYEQYWEKLYIVAYNRLQNREIAEELVQEVFTNLWLRRDRLAIRYSLSTYLYCSLKYEVFNYLRAKAVRKRFASRFDKTVFYDNSTEKQLSFEELSHHLQEEIGKLPEKCRLVFTLSRQEGYSYQQIADELAISPKTVEVHISKALKSLRFGLQELISLLLIFVLIE